MRLEDVAGPPEEAPPIDTPARIAEDRETVAEEMRERFSRMTHHEYAEEVRKGWNVYEAARDDGWRDFTADELDLLRRSPVPRLRETAANADEIAGRDLRWVRRDPDPYVREVAAAADVGSLRPLAWVRRDPSPIVRRQAARAARRRGWDVQWALDDPDREVRKVAGAAEA